MKGQYGRKVAPHPTVAKLCIYGKLVCAKNKAASGESGAAEFTGDGGGDISSNHNRLPLLWPWTQKEN